MLNLIDILSEVSMYICKIFQMNDKQYKIEEFSRLYNSLPNFLVLPTGTQFSVNVSKSLVSKYKRRNDPDKFRNSQFVVTVLR